MRVTVSIFRRSGSKRLLGESNQTHQPNYRKKSMMQQKCSKMEKVLIFSVLVAGLSLGSAQAALYPDMKNVEEPTTNYPASFSKFNPPIDSSIVVDANAPQIAEWTRQNNPGDTMALSGENLSTYTNKISEGRDTRFVFFGNGYQTADGLIDRLDGRLCAVTLPTALPAHDMYLMWPRNGHGFGEPIAINQTEAWWVGPDLVSRGDSFSIYGRNLSLDGTNSYAYIKGYGWISSTSCNPYKADFVVPNDLKNGTYTIYAHNGHGGKYGWSTNGITLTIKDMIVWNEDTNTWRNVKNYGAVGDGVTDDYKAIASAVSAAISDGYGTVYFPSGVYMVGTRIYPNSGGVRYKGAGMDKTTLEAVSSGFDGSSYNAVIVPSSDTAIEDMTINKGDDNIICVRVQGGGSAKTGIRLNRVRLSCLGHGPLGRSDGGTPLYFASAEDFRATDCEFIVDYGISGITTRQIFFDHCTFLPTGDCNGIIAFSGSELSMNNCYAHPLSTADSTSNYGWGKGRWIYGGGTINKIYIGGNTSTNMVPRSPAVEFSETSINITGSSAAYSTNYVYFNSGDLSGVKGAARLALDSPPNGYRSYPITTIDVKNRIVGIKRDWYTGTFPTSNPCEIREVVDQNSGEQFLWEAMNAYYRGSPTVVSNASTIVFTNLMANYNGWTFTIADGKGMGQSSKINGVTSDGVVHLADPLRVLPDSTSVCKIGKFLDRVVVYKNNLNGSDRAATPGVYTATTGFNCYGGASRLVIDGNRFGKMKTGLMLWSNSDKGDAQIIQPNVFNMVKDNTIDTCQNGISQIIQDWGRAVIADRTFYGNITRGNLVTHSTVSAFSESTSSGRQRKDLCVFDKNTAIDNAKTFSSSGGGLYDQVWVNNRFQQNGGDGIPLSSSESDVLQNNQWSGFTSKYIGTFSGGIMNLPHRVVYLSKNVQSAAIPLWNCGTAPFTWIVDGSSAPWLTVSPSSGSTVNEQGSTLTFNLTSEPSSDTEAVVTVNAGTESRQLTVYYSNAQIVSSTKVVYPLSGFSGVQVRAILLDEVANMTRNLGDVQNMTELVIDNLVPGHWYKLTFEKYDATSGTWTKVQESHFKM